MRVTLADIDKAVRANFIIDPHGSKYLDADRKKEWHFSGAARVVFVGIALENQFRQEAICDHLDITITEFNGKARQFREHWEMGKVKNLERKRANRYDKEEALDQDLRVYRKSVLVRNCVEMLKKKRLILF
jgi:hypothetical protein